MSDNCPSCETEKHEHHHHAPESDGLKTYIPLLLILAGIVALTAASATLFSLWQSQRLMSLFMGWFFIVFGTFKLFDLRGFADGYSMYDLIARRSRPYAFAYPFIELALGVAYLTAFQLQWINLATVIIMTIGSIGVINSLIKKQKIECACLGTKIKLPLGVVTLLEDAGMGLMALAMLITG